MSRAETHRTQRKEKMFNAKDAKKRKRKKLTAKNAKDTKKKKQEDLATDEHR
jgi:hypothetical protein